MGAQGCAQRNPGKRHHEDVQTLKALAKDLKRVFANVFSVRARFSFRTQGRNPGLKFANSFGVHLNLAERRPVHLNVGEWRPDENVVRLSADGMKLSGTDKDEIGGLMGIS